LIVLPVHEVNDTHTTSAIFWHNVTLRIVHYITGQLWRSP
jgi:hypothetical protein